MHACKSYRKFSNYTKTCSCFQVHPYLIQETESDKGELEADG